jgi:hypothetical protein
MAEDDEPVAADEAAVTTPLPPELHTQQGPTC